MIKIIKDISKKYDTEINHVLVKNLDSYFLARRKFFENYGKSEFEIVIKNKSFYDYFLDFEEYENVEVREIYEIEGPKIDLGPKENIFKVLLTALKYKDDKNICKILEREYFDKYNFLKNIPEKSVENYLKELIKVKMFSKYKEHNFYTLLGHVEENLYENIKNDMELEKYYSEEEKNLNFYLDECNDFLEKNSKKMAIFSEFSENNYLEEITGNLKFEKNFYIEKIFEKISKFKNLDILLENIEKAEKKFNYSFQDLKKLILNLILIKKESEKDKKTYEDYRNYFLEVYLNFKGIPKEKNIGFLIEELENKYKVSLKELKNSINNIWININTRFEKFYLENYSSLYSSIEQKGLDYAIENSLPALLNNKKKLYIFIDCLRYDLWIKLKKYMKSQGYNCHYEKQIISAIPTVTSYCKNILYSGQKYNQLESKNNFKMDVLKISTAYELKSEIESNNFLYEIIDLDKFFHEIKELTNEYLESVLELKLNNLLKYINKDEFDIIVMTDHGAMKLDKDDLTSFKYRDTLLKENFQIENHGRYIKIYSEIYNEKKYNEIEKMLREDDSYYIITRDDMAKYYLPCSEKGKENYFYLIYKYGKYPKRTGEFNHGGISLEEVIIPYGVFRTEIKEFKALEIELKTNELKNTLNAELDVLIINDNFVQKLIIKSKYREYEKTYLNFEGNKRIKIPLNLDKEFEGTLDDILELEYYIDNQKYILNKYIKVNILRNSVLNFNKKLKNSRSLL